MYNVSIFLFLRLFSRHCLFQSETMKPLEEFGEELKIPLYVEIIEEDDDGLHDTTEFLENSEDGKSIRNWAIIPKRLITNVNIMTIHADDGKQLNIAKIG